QGRRGVELEVHGHGRTRGQGCAERRALARRCRRGDERGGHALDVTPGDRAGDSELLAVQHGRHELDGGRAALGPGRAARVVVRTLPPAASMRTNFATVSSLGASTTVTMSWLPIVR